MAFLFSECGSFLTPWVSWVTCRCFPFLTWVTFLLQHPSLSHSSQAKILEDFLISPPSTHHSTHSHWTSGLPTPLSRPYDGAPGLCHSQELDSRRHCAWLLSSRDNCDSSLLLKTRNSNSRRPQSLSSLQASVLASLSIHTLARSPPLYTEDINVSQRSSWVND